MKKFFALVLAAALLFSLAACGTKTPANEILLADMLRDDAFDTIYVELELAGLTKEQKQELTGLCTRQLSDAYGSEVEVILYFAEDDPDGTLKQEMLKCPNIVCTFPDQEQVDKSQLDLIKVAQAIVTKIIEEIERTLATLTRSQISEERTSQGGTEATQDGTATTEPPTEAPNENMETTTLATSMHSVFPDVSTQDKYNAWYSELDNKIEKLAKEKGRKAAIEELDRLIATATGNDTILRGLYAMKRTQLARDGQPEAAIEAQISIIAHSPDYRIRKEKYDELASMYEQNGNYAKAIEAYEITRDMVSVLTNGDQSSLKWYDNKIAELKKKL